MGGSAGRRPSSSLARMHLSRIVKPLLCALFLVPAIALAGPKPASEPRSAVALLEEGIHLLKAKDYERALTVLQRCVALDPKLADCHLKLGSAYAYLMEFDKAAEQYREFLKLDPDSPYASRVQDILKAYEQKKREEQR